MKTIIFLVCFAALSITASSKPNNLPINQIVGTWKFSSQSKTNDFQKVFANKADYKTELFTFGSNHKFTHEFINNKGNSVKTLKGKWKFAGNKIMISYSGIDYIVNTEYFYIGNDLVLGNNFNHVVFIRENIDFQNVAAN